MGRTGSLLEDEEAHDSSSPSDSRRTDQKLNVTRSKHSETEQRRRSKINERFQILREMIPENDQKRDKASFLLEVIQYIQFLQEKLQIYEGSCQGWSPEPSKLIPWKISSSAVESFANQPSHLDRNSLGSEDNVVLNSALLSNSHNSVDPDLTASGAGAAMYKYTNDRTMSTSNAPPLSIHVFGGLSCEDHDGSSIHNSARRQALSDGSLVRSCKEDCCSVPIYPVNGDDPFTENGEADASNNCSQRLLNSLVKELESSGVDLSQASISVHLDVRKQAAGPGVSAGGSGVADYSIIPTMNLVVDEEYGHCRKKLRGGKT